MSMDMAALAANPSLQYGEVKFPMDPTVRAFLIVNIIFEVLVVAIVGLRCYARRMAGLGADDYFCIAAAALGFVCLLISGLMSTIGNGYPVTEVMMNLATHLRLTFILQPFYFFSMMCSKLSVCFFYLRIFPRGNVPLITKVMIVIIVLWATSHYLAGVFICSPVSAQFDLIAAATGKCLDQIPLFQSFLIINIVTDIGIMAIPISTIMGLKMRNSDKLGICGSFLIGIALVIMGVFRIVYVSTVDIRGDLTGTMPVSIFLTALEPQLACVTISIPMLRPLWMRFRGIVSSNNGSKTAGPSGSASQPRQTTKRSKVGTQYDLELTVYDGPSTETKIGVAKGSANSISSESSEQNLKDRDVHRITVEKQYGITHESS